MASETAKSDSSKSKIGALLIHGITGSPTEMKTVASRLRRDGIRVSMPLLVGHGKGHRELLATDRHDWLQGVREAFDEMAKDCEAVYIVGLCGSSILAALLAAEETRATGLVLLSTHYGKIAPGISIRRHILPLVYFLPATIRKKLYWTEKAPFGIKDERMQAAIAASLAAAKKKGESGEHGTFRTYAETFYQLEVLVRDLKKVAHKVTCPALLVHSIEDTWFTIENSIDLCRDIGSASKQVLLINNCNHVLTVDLEKTEVARQVSMFIQRQEELRTERIKKSEASKSPESAVAASA